LRHPDPALRREAAEALGAERILEAVPALTEALRDWDRGVRDAAAEALIQIGREEVAEAVTPLLGDEDIGTRNLAMDVLVNLGEAALGPMHRALKDPDPDVRKFAADILGRLRDPRAVEELIRALEDPDPNVVCAAVEALGHLGAPEAVGPLKAACGRLEDAWPLVVEALGEIGIPGAMDVLLEAVGREDPSVSLAAVEALGKVGDERALEVLSERVDRLEPDPFTAPVWASALARLAGRLGKEFWGMVQEHRWEELVRQATLGDEEGEVLEWVREGLEGEKGTFVAVLLTSIVGQLPQGLKTVWIEVVERFRVGEAVEGLKELASEGPPISYKAVRAIGKIGGEKALQALERTLKSEDTLVRIGVAQALGDIGDPRALGVLRPLTEDPNPDLARAAREAIERIRYGA